MSYFNISFSLKMLFQLKSVTLLNSRSSFVSKLYRVKPSVRPSKMFTRNYVTEVINTFGDVPAICILGLACFGAYSLFRYFLPPSAEDDEEETGESPDQNPLEEFVVDHQDKSTQVDPNILPPIDSNVLPPLGDPLPDWPRFKSLYDIFMNFYLNIRDTFPPGQNPELEDIVDKLNAEVFLHKENFDGFPSIYEQIYFSDLTLSFAVTVFLSLGFFLIRYRTVFLFLLKNYFYSCFNLNP